MLTRSLFFAPANRPELIAKFPRIPADCFIVDLEDGTPSAEKISARRALPRLIDGLRTAGVSSPIFVRVNSAGHELHEEDARVAASCAIDGIALPKLESNAAVVSIAEVLDGAGRPPRVIGGVESAKGVMCIEDLVAARCGLAAVYFGAEDLASELQARRTAAGIEMLYARSRVVLAARAYAIEPIDQAVIEVRDDDRFAADAEMGRDLGYGGKICLLPRQVALAHRAFSPSTEEITRAERIISAYEAAVRRGLGTIDVDGQMIDGPLLKRAQRTLQVARRA